ncbi:unnamed protein product [Phytophthora fragariaefolia]|uniref:Unnamed protein product n=1 Tax=Phytophthora fragariaefolia TaxID=1490495 RepID=A0A9W6YMY0_9STRA|nr:unnamed protein product [Phytophthora fragariaefolia]
MSFAAAFLFLLAVYEAAAEEACSPLEVVKFAELYANPHLHPCQKVSAVAPLMGYPTGPQLKAMRPTDSKYYLAPKPTDSKYYPSTNKHYPTPKPTENDKHYPTPKPTDYEDHPTPKPTEGDKHNPTKPYHSTMKPTDGGKDHNKQESPKIVTIEIEDKLSSTFRSIGKETAKDTS